MSDLTKTQIEDYILNPIKCPFCGDEEVSAGVGTYESDQYKVKISCNKEGCEKCWTEIYKLKTIE